MAAKHGAGAQVAQNRRARFDYQIEDTVEAGIILTGTEVKSLREGSASLGEAYAGPREGAIWLINATIPEYKQAGPQMNHDPKRPRKLLLHRREQARLAGLVRRDGYTLVPLRLYFNARGIAKLELGLAKGKKQHDKRQAKRDRDWQREKARVMRKGGIE